MPIRQRPEDEASDEAPDVARPGLSFPTDAPPLTAPQSVLREAEEYGLSFEAGEIEAFGRLLALVRSANELLNLTAVIEPVEMWRKHVLDSLTLLPMLAELPEGSRVADVGSGAGFPGLPLAIAMPMLRFTLIESTAKKATFIRTAAGALGLKNVRVLAARAEDLAGDWVDRGSAQREAFDAVAARAVGRLAIIAELCVPLAKVGGLVLLIKGQKADEEIAEAHNALEQLHAHHAGTVESPTGRIVVLEKTERTPRIYPRRPGEAAKNPL